MHATDEQNKARILKGRLQGQSGQYVCDLDGWMLGFVPDNYENSSSDTIVWGPRGAVVLVILRDGTMQNPDGTYSAHTDPIEYLLCHAQEIIQSQDEKEGDDTEVASVFGRIRKTIKIAEVEVEFDLHPNDYGLFLVIGQAMSEIQSFEFLLAGLLASLDKKEEQMTSHSTYEELLEKNYTRTLGMLVGHFRDHIGDPETADALAYARDRRNFLVHGLLRKYSWPMISDSDYKVCVLEIGEVVSAIAYAEDKLVQYLNESQKMPTLRFALSADTWQLTEDEIAEEIAKQLEPWKKKIGQ